MDGWCRRGRWFCGGEGGSSCGNMTSINEIQDTQTCKYTHIQTQTPTQTQTQAATQTQTRTQAQPQTQRQTQAQTQTPTQTQTHTNGHADKRRDTQSQTDKDRCRHQRRNQCSLVRNINGRIDPIKRPTVPGHLRLK